MSSNIRVVVGVLSDVLSHVVATWLFYSSAELYSHSHFELKEMAAQQLQGGLVGGLVAILVASFAFFVHSSHGATMTMTLLTQSYAFCPASTLQTIPDTSNIPFSSAVITPTDVCVPYVAGSYSLTSCLPDSTIV